MPLTVAIRRALEQALDDSSVHAVSGGGANTAASATLVNATANASTIRFGGRFIYATDQTVQGTQRVIRPNSYVPSTGTVSIDPAWAGPGSGSLEITSLFPCVPSPLIPTTSYLDLINAALRKQRVPGRVSVTILAGSETIAVSSFSWLLGRPDRVQRDEQGRPIVYEPGPFSSANIRSHHRSWELIEDDETATLRTSMPFAANTAIEVAVFRPADSRIFSGASSTWGESTAGLSRDDDQSIPPINETVEIAKAEAFLALAVANHGGANWWDAYEKQIVRAESQPTYDPALKGQRAQRPQLEAV